MTGGVIGAMLKLPSILMAVFSTATVLIIVFFVENQSALTWHINAIEKRLKAIKKAAQNIWSLDKI